MALSKAGWNIVLFARRLDDLKQAASECSGKTFIVQGDVTSEKDVAHLFKKTLKTFGMETTLSERKNTN